MQSFVHNSTASLMSFTNLKQKYSQKFSPGKIHFIGIGGIGMSAIALILHKIGCQIQGSDLSQNNNTRNLEKLGIKCFVGHAAENLTDDVVLVVETSIVKPNNPELIKAKSRNIPVLRRADMLAQIMAEKQGITVAGTHGKTSTTAMIAVLLETAGLDPMVINGGIINHFGSNAKFGEGKFLVAESDESDASFVDLPSFIGVVNNIEPEHLEFYGGDFELVKTYYQKYIEQIPENGLVAMCIDDLVVKKLYQDLSKTQKNLVSLSIKDENADYFGFNISLAAAGLKFDVRIKKNGDIIKDIKMPAYGIHNVKNALAPVAIGIFLGLTEEKIKEGLMNYSGVKRRFTKTGEVNGITIIDDYGHHSTEIKAVFGAARAILPDHKLIVVFQPHKYTRTRDLFDEFCNAFTNVDTVIIADIYSAGQEPIAGATQDALIAGIKKTGHKNVIKLNSENDLPQLIKEQAKPGDMVVCIGAGSISNWANNLPAKLKEIL
ncbi:MAG: UDP-N-acetylmuramate--L-alanine ligase [Pseudomonadota bacterium]